MNAPERLLTQAECTALRGLAIVAIVLHNYCHFIGRIVKENEYQYLATNTAGLQQVLTHPDALLPVHLLSFFGHYGVPVFLFLSGYGLVMKYERTDAAPVPCTRFVRYHYLKLLRMLIVGFSLFLMVDAVTPGRFAFHWDNVVAQLLMYINLLPQPDKIIWPGIYWFFGLMIELYLIYRLILYRQKTEYVVLLILACWLLQEFSTPYGEMLNRLRYNAVGGMLPFGIGIIMARLSQRKPYTHYTRWTWTLVALGCTVLTIVMSFSFHAWLWIPVVIILGSISIVKMLPTWGQQALAWLGVLSAAMFVAHPIARKLFITVAWKQDIYDGMALYLIGTLALSWMVKQVIDRLPSPKL